MKTLRIKSIEGDKSFQHVTATMLLPCAVILFGYGADLGDFKVYADSLNKNELKNKYGSNVIIKRIYGKKSFSDFFLNFNYSKYQIKELHIFAHSFGAGLSFPYHEEEIANFEVKEQMKKYRKFNKSIFNYEEVVDMEPNLLTDHFFTFDYILLLPIVIIQFKANNKNAFIKIWGCNSGKENWSYGSTETDMYYWRALNDENTPKPSIAQALANFFQVKTYGATSGSHSEVLINGNWITSQQYKDKYKKWPSTNLPHRLNPDKGSYYEFNPK